MFCFPEKVNGVPGSQSLPHIDSRHSLPPGMMCLSAVSNALTQKTTRKSRCDAVLRMVPFHSTFALFRVPPKAMDSWPLKTPFSWLILTGTCKEVSSAPHIASNKRNDKICHLSVYRKRCVKGSMLLHLSAKRGNKQGLYPHYVPARELSNKANRPEPIGDKPQTILD